MIVLSPMSAAFILVAGFAGGFLCVCLVWRMRVYSFGLFLIVCGLTALTLIDAGVDRSADGGVFTRSVGSVFWQKVGADD